MLKPTSHKYSGVNHTLLCIHKYSAPMATAKIPGISEHLQKEALAFKTKKILLILLSVRSYPSLSVHMLCEFFSKQLLTGVLYV